MEMKKLFLISILWALFLAVLGSLTVGAKPKPVSSSRVVVAYVTSWSQVIPDPQVMTHLNYAFGGVSQTFNGVEISNPQRLKAMVALKKQNPKLKVLLSVGGWGLVDSAKWLPATRTEWLLPLIVSVLSRRWDSMVLILIGNILPRVVPIFLHHPMILGILRF